MHHRFATNRLATPHSADAAPLETRQLLAVVDPFAPRAYSVSEAAQLSGLRPGLVVNLVRQELSYRDAGQPDQAMTFGDGVEQANGFTITSELRKKVRNIVTDNFVLAPIDFPEEWDQAQRDKFQQAAQKAVDWWDAAVDRPKFYNQYDSPIPVRFNFPSAETRMRFKVNFNTTAFVLTSHFGRMRTQAININTHPEALIDNSDIDKSIAHEMGHLAFGLNHLDSPFNVLSTYREQSVLKFHPDHVAQIEADGEWYFVDDSLIAIA